MAVNGFTDTLDAEYTAGTVQAFADLGYRIETPTGTVEPFLALARVHHDSDGFRERGGGARLTVDGRSMDTTYSTLGGRVEGTFRLGSVPTTASALVGWRHAYGDTTPRTTHAFAAGGDGFAVSGTPLAEDSAVIETGLATSLGPRATLGVSYRGQLAAEDRQHGLHASLSLRF